MVKPKVLYAEYCESFVVIYYDKTINKTTIQKGFTQESEARAFANQKEEEIMHPILWCND